MKIKNLFYIFMISLGLITSAYAQDILDADDLIVNMASSLDLNFHEEDLIKPLVRDYVAKVQSAYQDAQGNDQSIQSLISLLNYNLQQSLVSILTPEQLKKWDTAKKSLLPQQGN